MCRFLQKTNLKQQNLCSNFVNNDTMCTTAQLFLKLCEGSHASCNRLLLKTIPRKVRMITKFISSLIYTY
jgi:hypothetical protein